MTLNKNSNKNDLDDLLLLEKYKKSIKPCLELFKQQRLLFIEKQKQWYKKFLETLMEIELSEEEIHERMHSYIEKQKEQLKQLDDYHKKYIEYFEDIEEQIRQNDEKILQNKKLLNE